MNQAFPNPKCRLCGKCALNSLFYHMMLCGDKSSTGDHIVDQIVDHVRSKERENPRGVCIFSIHEHCNKYQSTPMNLLWYVLERLCRNKCLRHTFNHQHFLFVYDEELAAAEFQDEHGNKISEVSFEDYEDA